MAAMESSTVARKRTKISCETGPFVRIETPISPWSRFLNINKVLVGIRGIESEFFPDPGNFLRRGKFAYKKMGGVSGDESQHQKD